LANDNAQVQLLGFDQAQVELVISDIEMPGMSGSTLADLIRQEYPKTHVLLMSGLAVDDVPAQWRGMLVQKPFRLDHLLKRVNEALHVTVH
jgi:CheY-like chemotaxis protein